MYKHNPLPFGISKYKNDRSKMQRRTIVFSSPKLDKFLAKNNSNQKVKPTKSQSKEKSIHRIDSKEKPKILKPINLNKSFELSTAGNYQSLNISPMKQSQQVESPSYFNVNSLLKSRKTAQTSLKHSFQRSVFVQNKTTVAKVYNKFQDKSSLRAFQTVPQTNDCMHLRIQELIKTNLWQSYEGEIQNNLFHGYGTLYFLNDDKFMGFFDLNQPHGHGSFYNKQKQLIINGIWLEGKLLQIF